MARIDYRKIANEKAQEEAYTQFRIFLKTEKGREIFPNWLDLERYLMHEDAKIVKYETQIKEYRDFFDTLSSLLPRQFSTSDRIG